MQQIDTAVEEIFPRGAVFNVEESETDGDFFCRRFASRKRKFKNYFEINPFHADYPKKPKPKSKHRQWERECLRTKVFAVLGVCINEEAYTKLPLELRERVFLALGTRIYDSLMDWTK